MIIKIFSGKVIGHSEQILPLLGIAMSVISISNLIILYKLSKGNIKGYFLLLIPVIIEIFMLFYFSSELVQFSMSLVVSSIIFLICSIVLIRNNESVNNNSGLQ